MLQGGARRALTNCFALDSILLVGEGEADIGEGHGGKNGGDACSCIEACIANKELDFLEEGWICLDVVVTKAVFSRAEEEEEGNPNEVKNCIGLGAVATEECFHFMEHANWD
eukprot:8109294-Ditylum_brightwellii.AAC.1